MQPITEQAQQITLALNILTTIVTNLVTLAPIAIPFILAWRSSQHDNKQQAVESDVKRAGLIEIGRAHV